MQDNQISRVLRNVEKLPTFLQAAAKDFALGKGIPFVGTSGIHFVKTARHEWVATIKNRKKVGNHIGQVHACAMLLLAETIGILITAVHMSQDKLPLVKRIEGDFVRKSTGNLTAVARISEEDIQYIESHDKGELVVEVIITDEANVQPVLVKITSVWIPKVKKD